MEVSTLIEIYGPAGVVIFGIGWAYVAERSERKEAQRSEREVLMSVIPLAAALTKAVEVAERGSK